MARRREGLLELLVWVPWWVSVFLAAASWVAIVFLAPGVMSEPSAYVGTDIRS